MHGRRAVYSMLYPYTDKYLDNTEVPSQEKRRFNARIRRSLRGELIAPEGDGEAALWRLFELIEGQYCRADWPSNRTQLVDVIQSINTYLGFFLRPEGQWSGLSSKGSYRVRLHHQKPCNRRVTHAVGGCKAGKAGKGCHAFHRAVVHRVPNNPLFVLLPDLVAHLDPTFSRNLMMVWICHFAAAQQPSSGVGKS